jgi:hypothetical protein
LTQAPYNNPRPAGYSGYGAFKTPALTAGLSQNPYDAPHRLGYEGYGAFNTPNRTAGLSRPAYDSAAPAKYSGYGDFKAPAQRPASVFGDPRVGVTPLGAYPAAKPAKITWDNKTPVQDVLNNPAPNPYRSVAPLQYGPSPSEAMFDTMRSVPLTPIGPAWNVPPMGGALPADIGTALGVWSTNRVPPAAPHPGTPASQTAEAPSLWQDPGGWFQKKTGVDPNAVKQAAVENTDKYFDKVKEYGVENVKTYADQQMGIAPAAAKWAATSGRDPVRIGTSSGSVDAQIAPIVEQLQSVPVDQLLVLQEQLRAQGATPEELALIQQLIDQQTMRT